MNFVYHKILLPACAVMVFFVLCIPLATPSPTYAANDITVTLQIPIMGELKIPVCQSQPELGTDGKLHEVLICTGIAKYIAIVYQWGVAFAAILAVLAFSYAGVLWLIAGGDSGKVTESKKVMGNAIIGLLLALGSYMLLNAINPNLVTFNPLRVPGIAKIALNLTPVSFEDLEDSGDADGSLDTSTMSSAGIYCPKSGGASEFLKIINSFSGKVAYRYGAKGGPPPYKEQENQGGKYIEFNTSCPANNICLDCSGFISMVYTCAGLPSPGGGTANIFPGTEIITSVDSGNFSINGKTLRPGDLVGYMPNEDTSGRNIGHVIMYAGDGIFVETYGGGKMGRQPGANPAQTRMTDALLQKYRHIKRIP